MRLVKDPTPESARFADVLFATARLFDETAQAICNAEARERVARPALMRLLPHLSGDGIRPTELARRVDVSKQAVGQTLAEMARRGYVEYVADPADGRASLVRLTDAGREGMATGLEVLRRLETAVAGRVGRRTLDGVIRGLQLVLATLVATDFTPERLARRSPRPASRARDVTKSGRRRRSR